MSQPGNIFKEIRESRGIFQNFVADNIGITKHYLLGLENGSKPMQLHQAQNLLDFYARNYEPFTAEEKEEILRFMLGETAAKQFT